jgi:vitamin B12 transporter
MYLWENQGPRIDTNRSGVFLCARACFAKGEDMKKSSYASLASLALLAAIPGQQPARAAEVTTLGEVVVTAGRIEETKKEVTANVTVLSREEIEQAAARTVGDLFAELGLSHIQKYPGSLTSIAIRGFRTETHGNDL